MAPTKGIEREVKLAADLEFELPGLRAGHKTVRRAPQALRTAYFDTSDLRLWRQGITLRHRSGERAGRSTWTLKLPAGAGAAKSTGSSSGGPNGTSSEGRGGRSSGTPDGTLDRAELSWVGPADVIPADATRLLSGIVRRGVLKQVVLLETTRRRLVLQDADGTSAELSDDTVTVVGGHRDGFRFRQLELELGPGAGPAAGRVIRQLEKAGARPENRAKFAKALGLPSSPEDGQGAVRPGPESTVGEIVRASIVDALDRLLDHDYRLRLDPEQPSAHDVHQARVATRRLRSDLKMYRPILDPVWLEHTRDELQWLAQTLGAIRDADILGDNLGLGEDASAHGQRELRLSIGEQRGSASRELAERLAANRYLDLLDRLHAAGETPPFFTAATPATGSVRRIGPDALARGELPHLVRRRYVALRKKVHKAGGRPTDHELHRIRIGAKQLRYAAETAAPVVGKPAARMASAAERLQSVLGEHHDAVVAEQWLRDAVVSLTPAASFVAGRLAAAQERRQQELRREWRWVWDGLNSKKSRRWLD